MGCILSVPASAYGDLRHICCLAIAGDNLRISNMRIRYPSLSNLSEFK